MTQPSGNNDDYDLAARRRRGLKTAIGLGVFVVVVYIGYFIFQAMI